MLDDADDGRCPILIFGSGYEELLLYTYPPYLSSILTIESNKSCSSNRYSETVDGVMLTAIMVVVVVVVTDPWHTKAM